MDSKHSVIKGLYCILFKGDASPNQSLSTWLKCSGSGKSRDRVFGVIPHDMYVIGTQETSMTEKDLVNTLKAGLKGESCLVN